MTMPTIDGFEGTQDTPPQPDLPVQISYENFMHEYDQRASMMFSQLMRENAEVRAQARQLMFERDALAAEAEAAKAALKEFIEQQTTKTEGE